MIRDQTDGYIFIIILLIFTACKFAYLVTQGAHRIHIKDGVHILYNRRQTLQSHTGVNVFLSQFCIIVITVIIKLSKYVVPDFHITVAVAANGTIRLFAAVLLSPVIIYLRAWTAWACAVLPEIIFFSKTENTLCRDADLLVPDIKRLIILQIDRRVQAFRVQPHHLSQKFP